MRGRILQYRHGGGRRGSERRGRCHHGRVRRQEQPHQAFDDRQQRRSGNQGQPHLSRQRRDGRRYIDRAVDEVSDYLHALDCLRALDIRRTSDGISRALHRHQPGNSLRRGSRRQPPGRHHHGHNGSEAGGAETAVPQQW